jgi:hypothetical protein
VVWESFTGETSVIVGLLPILFVVWVITFELADVHAEVLTERNRTV